MTKKEELLAAVEAVDAIKKTMPEQGQHELNGRIVRLKNAISELITDDGDYIGDSDVDEVGSLAWYRAKADEQHGREGEIEFDDDADVSIGADDGAYVQGWIWVYLPEGHGEEDDDDEDE
jgi:hypothetical protein